MTPRPIRPVRLALAVVALVLVTLASPAWPQAPDPQSLVGVWSGTWAESARPGVNGRYYVTIDKVQGEKVFGKGEMTGRTQEFKFVGTLSGNKLTFGRTELTVEDRRMTGTSTLGAGINLTLTKEK